MGNIVPKTAIEYFKQERNKHTEPYRPFYDAAIEALEKREPRKFPEVERSHVKGFDAEENKIYTYECAPCPNCHKWVIINPSRKYCDSCGQALDWSD